MGKNKIKEFAKEHWCELAIIGIVGGAAVVSSVMLKQHNDKVFGEYTRYLESLNEVASKPKELPVVKAPEINQLAVKADMLNKVGAKLIEEGEYPEDVHEYVGRLLMNK